MTWKRRHQTLSRIGRLLACLAPGNASFYKPHSRGTRIRIRPGGLQLYHPSRLWDTTMSGEENPKPVNVDPRWCVPETQDLP